MKPTKARDEPPKESRPGKSDESPDSQSAAGLKTVKRAASVLRAVSAGQGGEGKRLHEIATSTGLHKATAFRVLTALIQEGLVEQDEKKSYHLGAETWILGMAASPRFDIRHLAGAALDRIAKATGDTVFLSIPSGMEAICVDRREGSFPIRTLTLDVGSRRPLGVGAGSLALLAFLPRDEVERTIRANVKALARYAGFAPQDLRVLVEQARASGYAFNEGRIVSGMSAVGVPI